MTRRTTSLVEALGFIHRAKRPPETNPNLVYSIMGEIRTLDMDQTRDFIRIAVPFSAIAGLAAAALFMLGTSSGTGVDDMLLGLMTGGVSASGMSGYLGL